MEVVRENGRRWRGPVLGLLTSLLSFLTYYGGFYLVDGTRYCPRETKSEFTYYGV